MNENQSLGKQKKIMISVKTFLENPTCSINEIAEIIKNTYGLNISTSSVQRYLKEETMIIQLFDSETYQRIRDLLAKNKLTGQQKGGLNSFENNEVVKDKNGKFIGVKKTTKSNRLGKKCNDTLIFANMILSNPDMSLQKIADFYNEFYPSGDIVTKDYVYDCISNKSSYMILAEELYAKITEILEQRNPFLDEQDLNEENKSKK